MSWASLPEIAPILEAHTYFDIEVERLGLEKTPEAWPYSKPLHRFAQTYRCRRYIPEWLLVQWGLDIGEEDFNLCPQKRRIP